MTDQWGFPSDDQTDFGQPNTNANKGLRSWAEKVNEENKALKDQLTTIQNQLKAQQVTNVFEDLGLPRGAAALYSGAPEADAIKAWADQVRTAFGVNQGQAPTDQTPPPPAVDPQTQANLQNFTQAGANAVPSSSIDDFQRATNNAGSIADLIANASQWSH